VSKRWGEIMNGEVFLAWAALIFINIFIGSMIGFVYFDSEYKKYCNTIFYKIALTEFSLFFIVVMFKLYITIIVN
jgi:hypothetical protein